MKTRFYIFIFVIAVFFLSCERDEKTDIGEYLVRYDHLRSSTAKQNKSGLEFASLLYPAFDSLVPYSKYGTEIYKVEYNTTFFGEKIVGMLFVSLD